MVTGYDNWLENQAEEHYKNCEPEVIKAEQEYEGKDEDGNVETSTSYTYNCEECDEENCEHWNDYNERQAEMDEALLWDL